jgi:cell division protein FtsN
MTQQDRGAYTPQTDAPLAFDARAPRGGHRPLPMALIASGVVLLVMIAAVVMYYRSGVRPAGAAPQTVGEPVVAVRTPPPANAQPADPAVDLDVYASQNVPATPTAPAFAPAPEQPAPRPAPQPGLKVQTVDPSAIHPVPAQPAPRVAAAAPAAPAPAPAVKAPAAPVATATAAAAGAMVQIGAYSSAALADKGYSDVAAAFPGPMGGKSKRVEPVARAGQATLYRGLIGGFASRADAQAFCDTLKASGRTCLVRG